MIARVRRRSFRHSLDVAHRRSRAELTTIVTRGGGRMPGFPDFDPTAVDAVIDYVITGKDTPVAAAASATSAMRYRFTGYNRFVDPEGYPAVAPPWGTLNAINMNTGEYAWKIPLGEYPELAAKGMKDTGTENYGGPVVTAGGLVFIGATNYDRKFRAFDKATGQLLWETTLPFSGNATPGDLRGRRAPIRRDCRRRRKRRTQCPVRRRVRGLRAATLSALSPPSPPRTLRRNLLVLGVLGELRECTLGLLKYSSRHVVFDRRGGPMVSNRKKRPAADEIGFTRRRWIKSAAGLAGGAAASTCLSLDGLAAPVPPATGRIRHRRGIRHEDRRRDHRRQGSRVHPQRHQYLQRHSVCAAAPPAR